jgi:hypothetical protein
VEVKAVGPRAPNMNAVAERWVQSVKQECLDHEVVFGEAHLPHILTEYLASFARGQSLSRVYDRASSCSADFHPPGFLIRDDTRKTRQPENRSSLRFVPQDPFQDRVLP